VLEEPEDEVPEDEPLVAATVPENAAFWSSAIRTA